VAALNLSTSEGTAVNIHDAANGRQYGGWHARGKIKKTDPAGNILDGQYAFNGEVVQISPRFQRSGQNYRVRFENPAAAFAAFLFENGLLPELLSPAEANQEWALALMDGLWAKTKYRFPALASPHAASDSLSVPSHRNGFSFNVLQVLIEHLGSVRPVSARSPAFRPAVGGAVPGVDLEAARQVIAAMRARSAEAPAVPTAGGVATVELETAGAVAVAEPSEDDEELAAMRAELAARQQYEQQAAAKPDDQPAPEPTPEPTPAPAPTTNGRKRNR
jgi:hypothetical protein